MLHLYTLAHKHRVGNLFENRWGHQRSHLLCNTFGFLNHLRRPLTGAPVVSISLIDEKVHRPHNFDHWRAWIRAMTEHQVLNKPNRDAKCDERLQIAKSCAKVIWKQWVLRGVRTTWSSCKRANEAFIPSTRCLRDKPIELIESRSPRPPLCSLVLITRSCTNTGSVVPGCCSAARRGHLFDSGEEVVMI